MVETVYSIVAGMIFFVLIGNFIGGYVGDKVLEQTRSVFKMCKTIESDGWREQCDQIEENFDDTIKKNESSKALYQFIGVMIPLGTGVVAILKKL